MESSESAHLESWLGQKFMGWTAVILLLFAAGFFLKYAFDSGWIGPAGQVSIAVLAAVGLCLGGFRMCLRRLPDDETTNLSSQMLTSAGIILLYLATFAAFGYYTLIPRDRASIYLLIIVVEAALLAGLYNAPAIAVMAVVGGLLSPILLATEVDQYRSLFLYLALFNAGVVGLALWRRWAILAPLALIGTQGLYLLWWVERYHPIKFSAVLTFQLALFGMYLCHDLIAPVLRRRRANVALLLNVVVNSTSFCLAMYWLFKPDYYVWLPVGALGLAAVYAGLVGLIQLRSADDEELQLTALAIALSLIAAALALRAEAGWIALGWAVEGAALWWAGLRLRALPLRLMAAALLVLAVGRFVLTETPQLYHRGDCWLLINAYAIPGLVIAACLLFVARMIRVMIANREGFDEFTYWACGLAGVLLAWLVLSGDVYQFTWRQSQLLGGPGSDRSPSTWLTVLWTVYAGVVLFVGFRLDSRPVRFTAQGLFLITLAKVMLVDIARLPGIYRVAAFFVLALVMGLAAYAYQRHFVKESNR